MARGAAQLLVFDAETSQTVEIAPAGAISTVWLVSASNTRSWAAPRAMAACTLGRTSASVPAAMRRSPSKAMQG